MWGTVFDAGYPLITVCYICYHGVFNLVSNKNKWVHKKITFSMNLDKSCMEVFIVLVIFRPEGWAGPMDKKSAPSQPTKYHKL